MNPAMLELRNLLGKAGAGVKCCKVCGKPDAKNTDKVNENCPAHKAALDEDLASQFRLLSRALGEKLTDFVQRERFNAQLEAIRAKLLKARTEHDAYTPESSQESQRKAMIRVMHGTLELMGVELSPNPAEGSEGEWSPFQLAEILQLEVAKLCRDHDGAVDALISESAAAGDEGSLPPRVEVEPPNPAEGLPNNAGVKLL